MNKSEYIEYELEENVKKREKLKIESDKKQTEYTEAKNKFESSEYQKDLDDKKEFLQTLREKHKEELAELKERQKLEKEGAMWEFDEAKKHKNEVLGALKSDMEALQKELKEIKNENKELNREKDRALKLKQLNVTSHAIVQYLDRAKGLDLKDIKKEIIEARKEEDYSIRFDKNSSEVPDHEIVEFLILEGKLEREKTEKAIVTDKIRKLALSDELIGSTGTYTRTDGFRLVVKNSSVVTFLPKAAKTRKKGNKFSKRFKRKPRKMKL
jgi:hypothetical protein